MERLRARSAALVVALFLLLSVAGVAGAAHIALPAAPQAQDQVENDQGENEQGADEDTDEDTTQDEDTDQDTTEDTSDGAQGEHGALVSAVAQNEACVGGPNDNHGWAVSQVARGLLVPDVLTGCPVEAPPTVTTQTTDTTDVTTSHGKSAEHRKDKAHKAKHNSGD